MAVRQRPPWMAAALTFVTFGVYWMVWFGQTWSEMKRVAGDPGMSPFWHALTPLVPVYGWFRAHAHFRLLAALAAAAGMPALPPARAVALVVGSDVFTWATIFAATPGSWLALALASCGASAVAIRGGQEALNARWRAEFGAASSTGAHWGEWLALVLCGLVFALVVLGVVVG